MEIIEKSGTKSLRVVLWITQILLALMFGWLGWIKAYGIANLQMYVPWTAEVPGTLVRFIGAAEFLGAAGLILPAATRIKPGLTTLASALLALTMVFAMGFHIARGEMDLIRMPVLLGLLAAFVAWGRGVSAPIAAR